METPPAGAQAPAYVGGATILLFDDDNAVREVTAAMLRDFGYVVHEVGSGGAALDFLEREQNIDLMLIDFAMPGMSGADVARRVRMCAPSLPTLFVTGFARSNGRQREPHHRQAFRAGRARAQSSERSCRAWSRERCTFSRLAPLLP
jgi:CheY-like chemotaxis protein